jgi:hypothetical protein
VKTVQSEGVQCLYRGMAGLAVTSLPRYVDCTVGRVQCLSVAGQAKLFYLTTQISRLDCWKGAMTVSWPGRPCCNLNTQRMCRKTNFVPIFWITVLFHNSKPRKWFLIEYKDMSLRTNCYYSKLDLSARQFHCAIAIFCSLGWAVAFAITCNTLQAVLQIPSVSFSRNGSGICSWVF